MLSKKKILEINNISSRAMNEVLDRFSDGYRIMPDGVKWFELPPDTWTKDETRDFDMLNELSMKIEKGVVGLLNKSKNKMASTKNKKKTWKQ